MSTDPIDLSIPAGTGPGDLLVFAHIDASGDGPVATSYRIRLPVDAAAESRGRVTGWREAIAAVRRAVEGDLLRDQIDGPRIARAVADWLEAVAPGGNE